MNTMRLEGSCHCGGVRFSVESDSPVPFMRCYCSICRKTAGAGGFAINLGALTQSMKVHGKRHLRIYRALVPDESGEGKHLSTARRYFCSRCGSALWLWDPTWPELVHPHASAIDTPLPTPPEHVHCLVGSKAPWVEVEGKPGDPRFEHYPDMSLAQWHEGKGLVPKPARSLSTAPTSDSVPATFAKAILEAFNAHDLDAVMAFFADDCSLDMPRGPDPCGRRLIGKAAVRQALTTRFQGLPDVHYGDDRHWICGNKVVSEWLLTGTTPEGVAVKVRGCDHYELRDGKVVRKDSYWKIVEAPR